MSQWRKCLTVMMFRSSLIPQSARLDPLCQISVEQLQALVAVAVDLSSSSEVENASSGGHVAPGNVISMSHRPDLRLEPTHLPLSYYGTWANFCKFALAEGRRGLAVLSPPIGNRAFRAHGTPQARITPNKYGI
jgi:hypothetical protein